MFNPLSWFRSTGRTEVAVGLYQRAVFHDKTFADLKAKSGPLIVIKASDLGNGVRFFFVQEYFDLLCSDISSFPVARAVAASSAVPVLLNPVVLRNYADCGDSKAAWRNAAERRSLENAEPLEVVNGIGSHVDKDTRQYVHFVDGGITDNLGLRALYAVIEVAGGVRAYLQRVHRKPPHQLVVISVDAFTNPEPEMDRSARQPSLGEAVAAMSSAQLHRYNTATEELMWEAIPRWAGQLSTREPTIEPHFIQVGFHDFLEPDRSRFFNRIPTGFDLSDEQDDGLMVVGRDCCAVTPSFNLSWPSRAELHRRRSSCAA